MENGSATAPVTAPVKTAECLKNVRLLNDLDILSPFRFSAEESEPRRRRVAAEHMCLQCSCSQDYESLNFRSRVADIGIGASQASGRGAFVGKRVRFAFCADGSMAFDVK